jgi:hypothetical protein
MLRKAALRPGCADPKMTCPPSFAFVMASSPIECRKHDYTSLAGNVALQAGIDALQNQKRGKRRNVHDCVHLKMTSGR